MWGRLPTLKNVLTLLGDRLLIQDTRKSHGRVWKEPRIIDATATLSAISATRPPSSDPFESNYNKTTLLLLHHHHSVQHSIDLTDWLENKESIERPETNGCIDRKHQRKLFPPFSSVPVKLEKSLSPSAVLCCVSFAIQYSNWETGHLYRISHKIMPRDRDRR